MSREMSIPGGIAALQAQAGAYDHVSAMIVLYDARGGVLYRNPAARALADTLYIALDHERENPVDGSVVSKLVRDTCHGGKPVYVTQTFHYSRNVPLELTLDIRPVFDPETGIIDGALLSIADEQIGFNHHHLARLRTQKSELLAEVARLSRLRIENEKTIRLFVSSLPIPIIVFNENLRIMQLNRAAEKLFGIGRREAIGLACFEILHCHAKHGGRCPARESGIGIDMEEVEFAERFSLSRNLLRTVATVRESAETVILEAFVDITDRVQLENRMERYRQELEDTVSERTSRLEETIDELDRFSYSVSHDLRSPLRAIDGFTSAIIEDHGDQLDDTAHHNLNRVRQATQRMSLLIDGLLKLSTISRKPISRRHTDLTLIARKIAADLASLDGKRNVQFEIEDDLAVDAENDMMHVVIGNLFENAWKFTVDHPTPRITLGRTLIDDEDVFYVSDNGAGFPMQYADKIFLPFHVLQPQSQTTGSGIGLATVQRIIHRHGGTIWVTSCPGEGATFYFTLRP